MGTWQTKDVHSYLIGVRNRNKHENVIQSMLASKMGYSLLVGVCGGGGGVTNSISNSNDIRYQVKMTVYLNL